MRTFESRLYKMESIEGKRKSTDVDGSIAGYFFQILLGINALTGLTNDDDQVGIECGADVRVITQKNKYVSIEAKFHKANMSRFCDDVVKTVFNFYCNSFDDNELYFITNVDLTTKEGREFFSIKWNDDNQEEAKIKFIKSCILKYCINSKSNSEKKFSKKYDEYKNSKGEGKFDFLECLEEDILKNNEKYSDYAYINSNIDYEEFVEKISFSFKNEMKGESIKTLEESIKVNLRINFKEYTSKLEVKDSVVLDRIINILMYKYLMNTEKNSEIGTENLQFNEKSKVSVKELKELLSNYSDDQSEYYDNQFIINLKDTFSDSEESFIMLINEKGEIHKKRLLEIYFKIRNEFFAITNNKRYEEIVSKYCLGISKYNMFAGYTKIIDLLCFLTIMSFIEEHNNGNLNSEVACSEEEDTLNNVIFNKLEKYCYKSMILSKNHDFESFFSDFIKETHNSPKLIKTSIVVAGEIFSLNHSPCNYKGVYSNLNEKVNFAIKQSKIKNNIDLGEVYRNIDFRCIQCVLLNEPIGTVIQNSKRFIIDKCNRGV